MTGVLEHRQRLAAVIDEHAPALELVPGERRIGGSAGEEEAVLLVDLGEVHGRRLLPFLERPEALGGRRLADVHGPVDDALDRRLAGGRDRVLRLQALVVQEAARDGGNQRRVEGGEACELDADLVAHRKPPKDQIVRSASSARISVSLYPSSFKTS